MPAETVGIDAAGLPCHERPVGADSRQKRLGQGEGDCLVVIVARAVERRRDRDHQNRKCTCQDGERDEYLDQREAALVLQRSIHRPVTRPVGHSVDTRWRAAVSPTMTTAAVALPSGKNSIVLCPLGIAKRASRK